MEGPYRDLGSGFARLTGAEGLRRGPSRISSVEDALLELLRNAQDAGARNIYVATVLNKRRYRTLLVLDDGGGIPDSHKDLIFEPGVTGHLKTRDLYRSGLSLHHIREKAASVSVPSTSNPTAIKATFDTGCLPEKSLQSDSRKSKSNLKATIQNFLTSGPENPKEPKIYLASPARILATLIKNRIIQQPGRVGVTDLAGRVGGLGLNLSTRTLQRVLRGDIRPATRVPGRGTVDQTTFESKPGSEIRGVDSGSITLDRKDKQEISAVLARAARKSYLEIGDLNFRSRAGRIHLSAELYEPEDEYEG